MARYIEKLLRVVSDMNALDEGSNFKNKQIIEFTPDELTVEDLDMVAAASQEYCVTEPDNKK